MRLKTVDAQLRHMFRHLDAFSDVVVAKAQRSATIVHALEMEAEVGLHNRLV